MVKKLTKHGNSLALVIDKPILELLKISADTPLDISTDGRCLIIAPSMEGDRRSALSYFLDGPARQVSKAFDNINA